MKRQLAKLPICAVLLANLLQADDTKSRWQRQAADLGEGVWGVDAIDVDADGSLELVAAGTTHVWALDPTEMKPRLLAETPGGRTIHAVALDVDLDGDRDFAVSRSASDWIRYREAIAAGKKSKQPDGEDWTVAWVQNPGSAESDRHWALHVLDRELHGVHGLAVGDVDADGHVDLLADSFAGPHYESSLAWFPAGKTQTDAARRLITHGQATGRPHYMDFADMNGDGRGDVLLGASTEGSFTWWMQPMELDQPWTRNEIAWEPGATHPRAVDVNKDGVVDVIGSAGHGVGIFWYAAPDWARHVIDESIRDVHAFDTGDLDGDGDIDAAGCSFSQTVVRWWENRGDGVFVAHDIDTDNEQQAYDLKITDLDGDGLNDILLAGRRSDNVVWYRSAAAKELVR